MKLYIALLLGGFLTLSFSLKGQPGNGEYLIFFQTKSGKLNVFSESDNGKAKWQCHAIRERSGNKSEKFYSTEMWNEENQTFLTGPVSIRVEQNNDLQEISLFKKKTRKIVFKVEQVSFPDPEQSILIVAKGLKKGAYKLDLSKAKQMDQDDPYRKVCQPCLLLFPEKINKK